MKNKIMEVKEVRFYSFKILFKGDGAEDYLKEEGGWWIIEPRREVWVYSGYSKSYQFRVIIHELVEMFLEGYLKLSHKFSHSVANVIEYMFIPVSIFLKIGGSYG